MLLTHTYLKYIINFANNINTTKQVLLINRWFEKIYLDTYIMICVIN